MTDPTPDRHRDAQPDRIEFLDPQPGDFVEGDDGAMFVVQPSPAGPEEPREGLRETCDVCLSFGHHECDGCGACIERRRRRGKATTPVPDTGAEHDHQWSGANCEACARDDMKCPLCGGPHLSATAHSVEELRAWEATHPVHINDGSAERAAMTWSEGYSEGFKDGRFDTGAEERLRAALEVGRLRALLEDLYDRSTPMHSQACAMQYDEADCICGTGPVLERVNAELRSALSGGSVDEERDSDES